MTSCADGSLGCGVMPQGGDIDGLFSALKKAAKGIGRVAASAGGVVAGAALGTVLAPALGPFGPVAGAYLGNMAANGLKGAIDPPRKAAKPAARPAAGAAAGAPPVPRPAGPAAPARPNPTLGIKRGGATGVQGAGSPDYSSTSGTLTAVMIGGVLVVGGGVGLWYLTKGRK